jgi:hypothetical protein
VKPRHTVLVLACSVIVCWAILIGMAWSERAAQLALLQP